MSSHRTLSDAPSAPLFQLFNLQSGPGTPAGRFYAEDGWIFREYPGKGIEIICRYDGAILAGHAQELSEGN